MFETIHDWMQWLGGNTTMYILPFLLVISVLVFVHEWGHYIVARKCGVKVETFSIGFGKKIWARKDKSGTEWQVCLIPLGGYVKMFGDTDPASSSYTESVKEGDQLRVMTADERSQAFFAKSIAQRAAIVFAGPAINFIFAIVVLMTLYATVGRPVTAPIAGAVIVGGAAQEAGFLPNDRIVSIDGKEVRRFMDIQRAVAITLDKPLTFEVDRGGKKIVLENVKPKLEVVTDRFGFSHSSGRLGIIGPGFGLDVDSIEAVDGRKGNIEARLKRRMDRKVTLSMKPMADDLPAEDIVVFLSSAANTAFLSGEVPEGEDAKKAKVIEITPDGGQEVVVLGAQGAIIEALRETWFVSAGTLQSLGQIVMGTRSPQELGGIIRIGAVTGDAAQQGVMALITLAALLSINLGLINLLPIPMLDGGHLLFYGIEAAKGSPVPEKIQEMALRFGFVILIALMVFANLNDLIQLSK